jgi:hypothetical protein
MSADGYDIQRWIRCQQIAEAYLLNIDIKETFTLTNSKGRILGTFENVNELLSFLFGYDWGVSKR